MLSSHLPWPYLDRSLNEPWMMFVDGENLTIQGQKVAKAEGVELMEGPFYQPDTFLWVPGPTHSGFLRTLAGRSPLSAPAPIQSHYYTSVVGNDQELQSLSRQVREAGFKPHIFKKSKKAEKSKGVDISLARDVLVHGFEGGFSYALLIAGDQDYLPLVQELQQRRLAVFVSFFQNGLGRKLRAEADFFFPLDRVFLDSWDDYLFPWISQQTLLAGPDRLLVSFHSTREDPDPTVAYSTVDYVRFVLGDHSCRTACESNVDPNMPPSEVEEFVRRILDNGSIEGADFIREVLQHH